MDDTTAAGNEGSAFTANETKLICAIMQNLTAEIQFDVDKVALELGYKNGGSLRARWNSLKRSKITGTGSSTSIGGVDKATPSKKAKATPKKAKAFDESETVGKDFYLSPLGKKVGKKGGKGKKAKVKTEEEDEAVDSVEGANGVAVGAEFMDGDEEKF